MTKSDPPRAARFVIRHSDFFSHYSFVISHFPAASSLFDWNERLILRPHVIRARADDLVVDALLDHVRAPARSARDDKERREHCRRHAEQVIRDRAEPIEIRKHLLLAR